MSLPETLPLNAELLEVLGRIDNDRDRALYSYGAFMVAYSDAKKAAEKIAPLVFDYHESDRLMAMASMVACSLVVLGRWDLSAMNDALRDFVKRRPDLFELKESV